VVYMERIDVGDQLDFGGLPDQIDPSVLSLDTNIAMYVLVCFV
jgi:PAB-dependent poly(A)-specific ribonuclease subunit 2